MITTYIHSNARPPEFRGSAILTRFRLEHLSCFIRCWKICSRILGRCGLAWYTATSYATTKPYYNRHLCNPLWQSTVDWVGRSSLGCAHLWACEHKTKKKTTLCGISSVAWTTPRLCLHLSLQVRLPLPPVLRLLMCLERGTWKLHSVFEIRVFEICFWNMPVKFIFEILLWNVVLEAVFLNFVFGICFWHSPISHKHSVPY